LHIKETAEIEMKKLQKAIAEKETDLRKLQPTYQKLIEEESRLNSDIRIIDQRCKELYSKQGHRDQFKTVEERDKHLKREMNWIDTQVYQTRNQIQEIQTSIEKENEENNALTASYKACEFL
jgi:chromosome segregation ATPase